MRINLVARGDDHVNNTARQILMYEALGYPVPQFAHLPMILGADKTRLRSATARRASPPTATWAHRSSAVVNYLVRLGWSHGDQEIFTRERSSGSSTSRTWARPRACSTRDKMAWVNHEWLKSVRRGRAPRAPYFQAAGLPRGRCEAPPRLRRRASALARSASTCSSSATSTRPCSSIPRRRTSSSRRTRGPSSRRSAPGSRRSTASRPRRSRSSSTGRRRSAGWPSARSPSRSASRSTGGTASPGMYDVVQILEGRDAPAARRRDPLAGARPGGAIFQESQGPDHAAGLRGVARRIPPSAT